MIIVADTNVLIAALVTKGLCTEVVLHAIAQRALTSSAALIDELDDTIRRKFDVTPAVARFLRLLRSEIVLVEPLTFERPICRDPDDDLVLGTAVAAKADAIVTGDRDLLVIKSFKAIPILTPRQYLERFV